MTLSKRLSLPDYIAIGILSVYFVAGLFLTSDYGVNWDDDAQRANGLNNWEFITGHNSRPLIESGDKYHGPAFELILISVEKAFHLTEYHDIILARHRCSFMLFAIGIGIFFLLCRKLFDSPWLPLAGMLMLLLSPRIFGEGFYNPKDTIFLVAIVIAMYSLLVFIVRPTYPHAVFHAFACAFMIDIRIIGIVFIPITIALICLHLYQGKIEARDIWKKLSLFVIVQFVLMILMWPILMTGPVTHLMHAYHQLSNYTPWDGLNKYNGSCVSSFLTPWHYHWLWILITIPELYTLLFIAGVFMIAIKAMQKGFMKDTKNMMLSLSVALFLFPLLFRSIKGSCVYDGWRHMYFVYPFMVLLAVYAIEQLTAAKSKIVRQGTVALLLIALTDSSIQITTMHPYEYTYFNHTANVVYKPIDEKFEMDYWGLSYKQGIEYLLAHHQGANKLQINFKHYPGHANYNYLSAAQRATMIVTDSPTYYLTTYRDYDICPGSYTVPGELIYTIHAQGNKVMGIYKLR